MTSNDKAPEPNISIRTFIQRLPASPSEPTSTLVLTSPAGRFVDIRVLKTDNGDVPSGELSFEKLDWAFAGLSVTDAQKARYSHSPATADEYVRHTTWHHYIDSQALEHPEREQDEGDMIASEEEAGLTLEYGEAVDEGSGEVKQYVEGWKDVDAVSTIGVEQVGKGERVCVVLTMGTWPMSGDVSGNEVGKARGIVVRIGQYCQGLTQDEDGIALQRWEWKGGWRELVRMGKARMPFEAAMEKSELWKVGEEVHEHGNLWTVKEVVIW